MSRRARKWLVLVLGICAIGSVFVLPARAIVWAPAPIIRARLLLATPRGSDKPTVARYLARKRYNVTESGGGNGRVPGYPVDEPFNTYLKAEVGHYRLGLRADVEAIYTFDESDRLRNVVIRRSVDAP
jgi:hypothetical protein